MKLSGPALSDQFRRMLDPGRQSVPVTRALVHVVGGMHAGAHIKFDQSPMKVGSSHLSDIVLRDDGIAADHAEIIFDGARWSIFPAGGDQALPVLQHQERGRFLRERVDLGHAKLVLSQLGTESARAQYEPNSTHQPAVAALIGGALVTTILILATVHQSFDGAGAASNPLALAEVDLSAWPDVRVSQMDDGSRQISGYVDTVEDRQALLAAIGWEQADNLAQLRSGDQLATQLREVLDNQAIKVRYVGSGVIRITGEVADQADLDRINWAMAEYESFVRIDNLTEFAPPPRESVRRALPFQIVDVIPGADGSFGDQNGNRYFIGARLPDGSILMAVREDAVEFRLNNEPLLYQIK